METLLQDLRYGMRMLVKNPGFTAVAVLSLALGIAATSAIFSMINSVMLRPLPYENPDRLVGVFETHLEQGQSHVWATTGNFLDWKKQNRVFEQMEMVAGGPYPCILTGSAEAERIGCQNVTPTFFRTLGVNPLLGRTFLDEDLDRSSPGVIVISHDFWQKRFAGGSQVLGQTLTVNGNLFTVIGVLPASFQFFPWSGATDVWWLNNYKNPNWITRQARWLFTVARLKPGVSLEQAQTDMNKPKLT